MNPNKLLGYVVMNGEKKEYTYEAPFESQKDIEFHRDILMKKHGYYAKNKKIQEQIDKTGEPIDKYSIVFRIQDDSFRTGIRFKA